MFSVNRLEIKGITTEVLNDEILLRKSLKGTRYHTPNDNNYSPCNKKQKCC